MAKPKNFDKWFKAQFGKLPMNENKYFELEEKERKLAYQAERIKALLRQDIILQDQYTASLYARTAYET